jgi:hypothetical protein
LLQAQDSVLTEEYQSLRHSTYQTAR